MNKVITIDRQYGSGGREIGEKLAARFGIPFYDSKLISRAADESGFSESAFENAEKKASNSLLYSIAMGMSACGNQDLGFSGLSLDDRIFLAQSAVIRKCADEGPCVIIGRCAEYILKDRPDVVNLFVHASIPFRVERAVTLDNVDRSKAMDTLIKTDKSRSNYYNYHSGAKWGLATNYHLSIDSSLFGIDATASTSDYSNG